MEDINMSLLKNTGNWGERKDESGCYVDIDRLNEYFAGVATDPNYNRDNVMQGVSQARTNAVLKHCILVTRFL